MLFSCLTIASMWELELLGGQNHSTGGGSARELFNGYSCRHQLMHQSSLCRHEISMIIELGRISALSINKLHVTGIVQITYLSIWISLRQAELSLGGQNQEIWIDHSRELDGWIYSWDEDVILAHILRGSENDRYVKERVSIIGGSWWWLDQS